MGLDALWPGERPEDSEWLFPREKTESAPILHTEVQILAKKQAIRLAAEEFADRYMRGAFSGNDELLYHSIENLNSLVIELKRG